MANWKLQPGRKAILNPDCMDKYKGLFRYGYKISLKFNNSLLFSPTNLVTFVH